MFACLLGICTNIAHADPAATTTTPTIEPDPPAPAPLIQPKLPSSENLDGLYLWIGPSGAASRIQADWDSTIGGDISVVRVRENAALGAVGASFGASRWTVRGGGRLWLDGIVGTKLGRMVGVSVGPMLELSELSHPHVGGSVGVWGFVGVTPYARVGAINGLGAFLELGLHLTLPVMRHRH